MEAAEDTTTNVGVVIAQITKGLTSEQQSYALLKQGRVYMEQEDYDSALETLNRAISLNVTVNNFITRAMCYEKIMSWEDAYFDYSFAIRLDPDSGLIYGHRGLCLAKIKKYDIALDDLSKACSLEPSNANYYNRASVNLEANNLKDALKDVNRVLSNSENAPGSGLKFRCLYLKGMIGIELGLYDTVIADMRNLLVANPNIGSARALLSKAFRLKGKPDVADTQISYAINVDGGNAEHYIERAHARVACGSKQKITEAITDLDIAVRLLMRPVGQNSQAVRRMSRQSSDLIPTLHSMSSRDHGKNTSPLVKTNTADVEQSRVMFACNPKASSHSKKTPLIVENDGSKCVTSLVERPNTAGSEKSSTKPSPLLAKSFNSRASRMKSFDSFDSSNDSGRISRSNSFSNSRRPRLHRSESTNKREALSELVGERSFAKRMQKVAAALSQRAETRLLLAQECDNNRASLTLIQQSLQDSIKVTS